MDQTEYLAAQEHLRITYDNETKRLMYEFAKSRRKFAIGDIITNGRFVIKIKHFGWFLSYTTKLPEPMYVGDLLRKDGTLKKKIEEATFYGSDANLELLNPKKQKNG
jgi:hypothetical protein